MKQGALSFASEDGWRPPAPPSLEGVAEVGFDTETTGLRWWDGDKPIGLSISYGDQAFYLPWGHRPGGNLDEDLMRRWAKWELAGKHIVGLNTRFDAHMMRAWGVDLTEMGCTFGDVGHYAALLDDHRRYFSLDAIAQDYLGRGKVKNNFATKHIADVHASQASAYGTEDAVLVTDLLAVMRPELAAQELMQVVELENSIIPCVVEMEKNGCPIDVEKLDAWIKETERRLTALHIKIAAKAGFRVNPNSPTDLERLFHDRKIENHATTETGRMSFTERVMAAAAEKDEVVAMVHTASHLENLRSKYLLAYRESIGADGILRTAFHQLRGDEYGTVSGRFSSSKITRDEGANVQQVMAVDKQQRIHGPDYIIRELFIPGSGLFTASDAKQIEYRIFAHLTNSPAILKVYRDDPEADFHATVGDMIHRYRPDFERKRVKNCNFAVLFGSGIKKMAEMLNVSQDEAQELLVAYDRAFPEARKLMRTAMRVAENRGYVKTILGRRTRFPKKERLHKALNGAVQGSAADVNKRKLRELYDARKDLGITLRMTVHDENTWDSPDEEAARKAHEILDAQTTELRVPILWDTKTGANWKECK